MDTNHISTIKDVIAKIPAEHLDVFMNEFRAAVTHHQMAVAYLRDKYGGEACDEYLAHLKEQMTWDKGNGLETTLIVPRTGEKSTTTFKNQVE